MPDVAKLKQLCPLQTHTHVQSKVCFLLVHRIVLQSDLQLQLIISKRDFCAGGKSGPIERNLPSTSFHPSPLIVVIGCPSTPELDS